MTDNEKGRPGGSGPLDNSSTNDDTSMGRETPNSRSSATDEGISRDGRQRVNISSHAVAAAWLREELGRGELAGVFRRDSLLVQTPRIGQEGYIPPREGDEDGPAQVRPLAVAELKARVEVRYAVGRSREVPRRTGKTDPDTGEFLMEIRKEWEPHLFPLPSATHAHNAAITNDGVPNLRQLSGVTHTPVMRPDGSVVDTPGYDAATRLLYLPDVGLEVPPVSLRPTPAEVKAAGELLRLPVEEFPFVQEHYRANWHGMLFTPTLRPMLPPPYPLGVIDAPSPGSGKSYLATMLRTIHGGVLRSEFPADADELRKAVTATLVDTTAPVVTFDNVRGVIRSSVLEGLLTTGTWSDRYLGHTRNVTVPNDRLWTITGNNAVIGGDLARRCLWVTIDPQMPNPHERTGFKLNPGTWTRANRGAVLHAVLTISRAWVLDGAPTADPGRSDDYAHWVANVRGLLSWAGFSGEFSHKEAVTRVESSDDDEWGGFLEEVHEAFGGRWFEVADVVAKLTPDPADKPGAAGVIDASLLPGDMANKHSQIGRNGAAGFTRSLGKWFGNREGRWSRGLTVHRDPAATRRAKYKIVKWGDSSS